MEPERCFEAMTKHLRELEKRRPIFNQHHRQFLNLLRDVDWVASTKLPDTPRATLTLLRNGWIERRATPGGVEYRITEIGLTELSRPR